MKCRGRLPIRCARGWQACEGQAQRSRHQDTPHHGHARGASFSCPCEPCDASGASESRHNLTPGLHSKQVHEKAEIRVVVFYYCRSYASWTQKHFKQMVRWMRGGKLCLFMINLLDFEIDLFRSGHPKNSNWNLISLSSNTNMPTMASTLRCGRRVSPRR